MRSGAMVNISHPLDNGFFRLFFSVVFLVKKLPRVKKLLDTEANSPADEKPASI
jgi:hypothetical protein